MNLDKTSFDKIFAKKANIKSFEFNKEVTSVFPNMISRSVPAYEEVISGIAKIMQQSNYDNTNIYDLGCSVGTTISYLCSNFDIKNNTIIGVDSSIDMIEQANKNKLNFKSSNKANIKFICDDILNIKLQNASCVILNYTLQFLPLLDRDKLIKTIYDAMLPNGILILSEKIKHDNEKLGAIINKMHIDFKRDNGYSDLEISQKRLSLENVLIPETTAAHYKRLTEAGFKNFDIWCQKYNFISILAVK